MPGDDLARKLSASLGQTVVNVGYILEMATKRPITRQQKRYSAKYRIAQRNR